MSLETHEVKFYLSGGLTNNNPNNSLGGDISSFFVTTKRLFPDITPEQALDGKTDYSCLYVNNISEDLEDVLFNAAVFTEIEVAGGGDVTLGIRLRDERQDFVITNGTLVTSGYFIATYYNSTTEEWNEFQVDWDVDTSVWAINFEFALRALAGLEDVEVSFAESGSTITFTIDFIGGAGNRYYEAMGFVSSTVGFTSVNAVVTPIKIFSGSPLMSIADEIDADTTPPIGIIFIDASISEPIIIGNLNPGEYFPVWMKRVVPPATEPVESDGFVLRVRGEITS